MADDSDGYASESDSRERKTKADIGGNQQETAKNEQSSKVQEESKSFETPTKHSGSVQNSI